MAFNNVNNTLQYIARKGNYSDLANAMALICGYSKIYTTGQVPTIKRLRGGIEASAVAGLESMLTGATSQTNSIQEYNQTRNAFFEYVAATNCPFYKAIDFKLYNRLCLRLVKTIPDDVFDCKGTLVGNPGGDIDEYIKLWNAAQDVNQILCNESPKYLFNTGCLNTGSYVVGVSPIQPNNANIHYNAPSVVAHRQLKEFDANRTAIVDREAEVKPQAIAKYSSDNI